MNLEDMNLEDLKKPFQPKEHKFNYEGWAYIDEDAISNRLDDVCGMEGWQVRTTDAEKITQTHWTVTVELSIYINNQWVIRSGTGEGTTAIVKPYKTKDGLEIDPLQDPRYITNMGENAKKGAATDALRRAARLWGIGRYLLNLPKTKYGKPTVTDEKALADWLWDNYAKIDDASKDDATINPNGKDEKPKQQPSNGNKPAPKPARLIPEAKAKTLHNTVQNLISLKVTNKAVYQSSYEGKIDYDGMRLPVLLFDEHMAEIDYLTGKADGFTKGILDSQEIKFSEPLSIKVIWYTKGNTLKMAAEGEHPIGFDNPQVLYQFQKESDGIDESILLEALGVDSLHDYKDGIYTARDALQRHLNPASNGTGKTIDMEDIYRKSQLGSSVYTKARQPQLDHMPAVDGDIVTTKEK